jgi:hypothetical protein
MPIADRVVVDLDRWPRRTAYTADDDLVFAHSQSGRVLDRPTVCRRFEEACVGAGSKTGSKLSGSELYSAELK